MKFAEYADYVIGLKEQSILPSSCTRIFPAGYYPAIGHLKLKDIRADHLNSLYTSLAKPDQNKRTRGGLSAKSILEHHVHILLITGARRGEILSLKWDKVDFEGNKIHIYNNVLYSADRGMYEDSPKTVTSNRSITLPAETKVELFERAKN